MSAPASSRTCFLSQNAGIVGVSQFGDTQNQPGTFGYVYHDPPNARPLATALDADGTPRRGPSCRRSIRPASTRLEAALKLAATRGGQLLSGGSHR